MTRIETLPLFIKELIGNQHFPWYNPSSKRFVERFDLAIITLMNQDIRPTGEYNLQTYGEYIKSVMLEKGLDFDKAGEQSGLDPIYLMEVCYGLLGRDNLVEGLDYHMRKIGVEKDIREFFVEEQTTK